MLANPYLLLAAVLTWVASLAGAGWFGMSYERGQEAKREAERAAVTAQVREDGRKLADGVAVRVERALAKIRVENTTINQEVRHEREIHHEVLDSIDCAIPASTIGVLNDARGYPGGPGAGKLAPGLHAPRADPQQGAAAGGSDPTRR